VTAPVLVVIDEDDKRVFEEWLNNDLSLTLRVLSPCRETLQGVAVESTFNWYRLVDCKSMDNILG
jgi:transposase